MTPFALLLIQKRLVVYSFVDASLLDEENTIQDVARRGFKIGPRGMKFILGNFRSVLMDLFCSKTQRRCQLKQVCYSVVGKTVGASVHLRMLTKSAGNPSSSRGIR